MKERQDHAYWRGEITQSQQRLTELEERGVDALSNYDKQLGMVMHGREDGVLDRSKRLVRNHIHYYETQLAELGEEVQQITLFEMKED